MADDNASFLIFLVAMSIVRGQMLCGCRTVASTRPCQGRGGSSILLTRSIKKCKHVLEFTAHLGKFSNHVCIFCNSSPGVVVCDIIIASLLILNSVLYA
jgi:hypothetical protein